MEITCRTNLDVLKSESWPKSVQCIPSVGDMIESKVLHKNGEYGDFRLSLTVVSVTWKYSEQLLDWFVSVELHCEGRSIREFYEWYAPHVAMHVSSFI